MMLKDLIAKTGDFCFDNRGLQFLPYALVALVCIKDLTLVQENMHFEIFCFLISMLGVLIRILTIAYVPEGTSGRNRGAQIAESLNQTGMYSVVRNPLYLGNFFIFLGIMALTASWKIVIINTLLMTLIYILIILREENFLFNKFGAEYENFAQKVNCIIPSFKNFVKPSTPFLVKKVIKNEHDTWLTTILGFIGMELVIGFFETSKLYLVPLWSIVLAVTFVLWVIFKVLKKSGALNIN